MMRFPLTLRHVLERCGDLHAKSEIVSKEPDGSMRRIQYRDFHRRSRTLISALQRLGLRPGDRVATLMLNHHAHLETFFAVSVAGGVAHPLNHRLHLEDLAYTIVDAGDRFLFVDDSFLGLLEELQGRVAFDRVVVRSRNAHVNLPLYVDYEDLIASTSRASQLPDLDEWDAASLCYTSGTTGKPKGILYSHRALVLHSFAMALADTLALSQRDVVLALPPMFHANGWCFPIGAAMVGSKIVFAGKQIDPVSLVDLCAAERVTLSGAVPTILHGILSLLEAEPKRAQGFAPLRFACGGSPPSAALICGLNRFGIRVVHAWGMSESTPLATVNYPKRGLDRADDASAMTAQGQPLPFIELRVRTDDGLAPWDGRTSGELEMRGPWVASRYHGDAEPGDRWTNDGWLRTGDVATIDEDGDVRVTDRTKDLIKSGGEWISPLAIELALAEHSAVSEVAVIAVPHEKWMERPLAVVVLRSGATASPEELRASITDRFVRWWLPDAFVFVDSLPRTSVGKVRKVDLRERYKTWFDCG